MIDILYGGESVSAIAAGAAAVVVVVAAATGVVAVDPKEKSLAGRSSTILLFTLLLTISLIESKVSTQFCAASSFTHLNRNSSATL